jgi:hypothetical protein
MAEVETAMAQQPTSTGLDLIQFHVDAFSTISWHQLQQMSWASNWVQLRIVL